MRGGTLALALKFGIALPDSAFILAVGMPDLGTKEFPAVPAFQLCRKRPAQLWLRPIFLLRSISSCTICHSAGAMMASWLPST